MELIKIIIKTYANKRNLDIDLYSKSQELTSNQFMNFLFNINFKNTYATVYGIGEKIYEEGEGEPPTSILGYIKYSNRYKKWVFVLDLN